MMDGVISSRVYARIGLIGNPSDGFFGKTISVSLANFYAEVTIEPWATICLVPHPLHDPLEFPNLTALADRILGQGYYGGIRLLQATCKRFVEYFNNKGITLNSKGFKLSYDTNIPRQCGLSGSSAIVCAALNCLLQYYGVSQHCPMVERPSLVLSCEEDLGITAGLQDRVIQVYAGVVYMDFDQQYMQQHGYGMYTPLPTQSLPPLYIMYCTTATGKDSGKVHSDVKQRWLSGDEFIRHKMAEVARLADDGRRALESGDTAQLAELMAQNFSLRRAMFGDAVVGPQNIKMAEAAVKVGAVAKLTGSGGALVVLCPQGQKQARQLAELCEAEGWSFEAVQVAPANQQAA